MTATAKKALTRSVKGLLALTVVWFVVAAVRQQGGDLRAQLGQLRLDPAPLLAAFVVAVVYRLLNTGGWVLSLRALRCQLPLLQGVRLWLVSETMRWLPGSVWSYVSRVYAARKAGVDPVSASLSISLELFLTIAAWGLTAAGGLWLSGVTHDLSKMVKLPTWPLVAGVVAVMLTGAVGVWVFVRANLLERMPKKVRDLLNDLASLHRSPPRAGYCAAALGFYLALCILNGLNFWLVLRALSPAPVSITAIIGINAVGWLVGFFAFMAPGGLGVREAGIAGMLALFYPLPVAVGGALLWRVLQIVVELCCLLIYLVPAAVPASVPGITPATHGETA